MAIEGKMTRVGHKRLKKTKKLPKSELEIRRSVKPEAVKNVIAESANSEDTKGHQRTSKVRKAVVFIGVNECLKTLRVGEVH